MHRTQLCTAARRVLVACGDLLGLAVKWAGGELHIVSRSPRSRTPTSGDHDPTRQPLPQSDHWLLESLFAPHIDRPRPRAQGDTPGPAHAGPSYPGLTFCATPWPAASSGPIPKRVDIAARSPDAIPSNALTMCRTRRSLRSLAQGPALDQCRHLCIVEYCP